MIVGAPRLPDLDRHSIGRDPGINTNQVEDPSVALGYRGDFIGNAAGEEHHDESR